MSTVCSGLDNTVLRLAPVPRVRVPTLQELLIWAKQRPLCPPLEFFGEGLEPSVFDSVALLDAAARADEDTVRCALESGADVNASDASGRTVVTGAIAGDSWGMVDVSDASFELQSRLKILELVLDHSDVSLYTLNAPVRGVSPLCLAAWLDLPEVVRLLVERSSGRVAIDSMDAYGATPLMYAARDCRLQTVSYLLANDARPDYRDINHRSSIQYALRHPYILWLCEQTLRRRRLSECKSSQSNLLTPLPQPYLDRLVTSIASDIYNPDRLPLETISLRVCARPTEALVQAVTNSDLPHLRSLLFPPTSSSSSGPSFGTPLALVNLPDSTGWSPIHYCTSAQYPSVEVLDTLYRAGADVCLYTASGDETPLHCLAYKAKPATSHAQASAARSFVLHLVRDLHAPLSATDHYKNTPLHIAAEHGRSVDVLAALLACDFSGEVRELRNAQGLTALEVARPEFRIAFGVDREHTRSMSSASIRTIRPSTAASVKSMPSSSNATYRARLSTNAHVYRSTEERVDYSYLPDRILDNLRSVSSALVDTLTIDTAACTEDLDEISDMRSQLFPHLRSRIRDDAEELRYARGLFEQAYASYQEIKRSVEDTLEEVLDDLQDTCDHGRRRTTDSGDSDATAVSDASYVLLSRRCRSMSDLKVSRRVEPSRSMDVLASDVPILRTTGIRGHDVQPGMLLPSIEFALTSGASESFLPHETASVKELLRKRSHTFNDSKSLVQSGSDSKESAFGGASKIKAWFLKKLLPELSSSSEAVRGGSPTASLFRGRSKHSENSLRATHPTPADLARNTTMVACRRCLIAARRDLSRLEACLDSAEQLISLANRSISQAEMRLNKAILARRALLECICLTKSRTRLQDRDGQSYLDWPSSTGHEEIAPTAESTSSANRSRAGSTSSSVASVSSTLVEGEDEDVRTLRRLLMRKVDVRMNGAEEETEKAIVWLRIIKDTLRRVGTWTRNSCS